MHRLNVTVVAVGRQWRLAARAATLFGLLFLAACTRTTSSEPQPGSYRATVEIAAGKLVPFGLDVAQEERGTVLYVINGDERIRLDELKVGPGTLEARFPGYETVLQARVAGEELTGEVLLPRAGGKVARLPFKATLGATWRFFPDALPQNADVAGRWSVEFTGDGERREPGVATFEQSFERVTGTVQLPDADQRFLAGEVRDEELRLSRFDGGAAVLYEARLDEQGRLVGTSWSDRGEARRFVATRDADATIDAAALATRLRNPLEPFTFAFRDLDGKTVASSDPLFKDKVVLVTLAGSWCPNSHDEAALLVQLDRKYRAKGLQIVSLMFEQHAEFEQAVQAVKRFRQAHGIQYPTLIAGEAAKAQASAALPQLDAVAAFPTAIFIDRAGLVRSIQTGFAGPATGVQHDLLAHDFELQIEELLGSPAEPEATPATVAPVSP
jgi:thiol-disulfide isomerase/thioredoxin